MENNIFRQSSFSRTIINEAKMGAYYTDAEHCRRIGRLLDFPEEFIALEPSIGDGSAIAATLDYCFAKDIWGRTESEHI